MLVANIPWHAGDSMSRVIDPDVSSVTAWLLQYAVFDQRFLPIFCMLFGAGALLLASRPNAPVPFYALLPVQDVRSFPDRRRARLPSVAR